MCHDTPYPPIHGGKPTRHCSNALLLMPSNFRFQKREVDQRVGRSCELIPYLLWRVPARLNMSRAKCTVPNSREPQYSSVFRFTIDKRMFAVPGNLANRDNQMGGKTVESPLGEVMQLQCARHGGDVISRREEMLIDFQNCCHRDGSNLVDSGEAMFAGYAALSVPSCIKG